MTSNGGGTGTRNGGAASISAAATAFASAETRFPPQQRRRRWRYFWSGFSCFRSQKGGKRVVPASRIPDVSIPGNHSNGPQSGGISAQSTALVPSLLAPPSSPASFTNSALPSTAQSPSCFLSLSANMSSLDGPSSTMFTTGPYAHETQLVSPPVFSTFTTEPSTAPLTPPPELAHLTTPSSPDVPFARLLLSSLELKGARKEDCVNLPYETSGYVSASDLQAAYQLYPGSPASRLVSPKSGQSTAGLSSPYPEQEFPPQWSALISSQDMFLPRNKPSKLFGNNITTFRNFSPSQESSFFCPAASAQFYLDQAQQPSSSYPHCGGRLSLSREADAYSNVGNTHHRHSKARKSDAEEIEAYRVSFGFSADEIITAPHYVDPSDVIEDSFTIIPFATTIPYTKDSALSDMKMEGERMQVKSPNSLDAEVSKSSMHQNEDGIKHVMQNTSGTDPCADAGSCERTGDLFSSSSSSNPAMLGQEIPPEEDLDVSKGCQAVLSGPGGTEVKAGRAAEDGRDGLT
ncbi:Uncharacterized protein EJ110_NYTH52954 [Nymphaea thermarum]|nr:Uncharacterized protein EJ110_NYTH52954 [Nymphaea thermarum]